MNAWAKRGLQAAFFTGGMLALGTGIASATECCPDRPVPPLAASVSVPMHLCDNVVGTPVGPYTAPCTHWVLSSDQLTAVPAGMPVAAEVVEQYGRGNRGRANVMVPLDVSGNAFAMGGDAESSASSYHADYSMRPIRTDSSYGPFAGNAVAGDAAVPVVVTGNAGSALGTATSSSDTTTIASSGGGIETDGRGGPLSGNVFTEEVATPVQFSGNALAAPTGRSSVSGSQAVAAASGGDVHTAGDVGPLSGNVGGPGFAAPLQFNGNSIAWGGVAYSEADAYGQATAGGDAMTSGDPDRGAGYVVDPAVAQPASVSGNSIAWIARSQATGSQDAVAVAGAGAGAGKHRLLPGELTSAAEVVSLQAVDKEMAWLGNAESAYDGATSASAAGRHSETGRAAGRHHADHSDVSGATSELLLVADRTVRWLASATSAPVEDADAEAPGDVRAAAPTFGAEDTIGEVTSFADLTGITDGVTAGSTTELVGSTTESLFGLVDLGQDAPAPLLLPDGSIGRSDQEPATAPLATPGLDHLPLPGLENVVLLDGVPLHGVDDLNGLGLPAVGSIPEAPRFPDLGDLDRLLSPEPAPMPVEDTRLGTDDELPEPPRLGADELAGPLTSGLGLGGLGLGGLGLDGLGLDGLGLDGLGLDGLGLDGLGLDGLGLDGLGLDGLGLGGASRQGPADAGLPDASGLGLDGAGLPDASGLGLGSAGLPGPSGLGLDGAGLADPSRLGLDGAGLPDASGFGLGGAGLADPSRLGLGGPLPDLSSVADLPTAPIPPLMPSQAPVDSETPTEALPANDDTDPTGLLDGFGLGGFGSAAAPVTDLLGGS